MNRIPAFSPLSQARLAIHLFFLFQYAAVARSYVLVPRIDLSGGGRQDRTADLRVMNPSL